jgi:vacuolar-type H+-ATPase subunit H
MAKETIQAVRQAELNAAQIERDAVQRKESIISDAALKAKTLTDSMTKAAKEEAANRLSSAIKQGEELQEAAGNRAENEVMIMKQLASSKEEAAINFVLSSVING